MTEARIKEYENIFRTLQSASNTLSTMPQEQKEGKGIKDLFSQSEAASIIFNIGCALGMIYSQDLSLEREHHLRSVLLSLKDIIKVSGLDRYFDEDFWATDPTI